jgi:hypothetical protein
MAGLHSDIPCISKLDAVGDNRAVELAEVGL